MRALRPSLRSRRGGLCALALSLGLALGAAALAGCGRRPASRSDCDGIFGAIVDRELQERGFSDKALAARKKQELRAQLATELGRCVGRPLRPNALACVARAKNVEQISHRCLH